jgi:hypothetical protein
LIAKHVRTPQSPRQDDPKVQRSFLQVLISHPCRSVCAFETYRSEATPLRSCLPFVVQQASQKGLVVEVPYLEVEGLREHHGASAYLLEVKDDGSPCR